jgi:hypothetical protein
VEFDNRQERMAAIAERVAVLRQQPVSTLSDAELEGICALALLGIARVRLEHVEVQAGLRHVIGRLSQMLAEYRSALAETGVAIPAATDATWPFDLAAAVLKARSEVDRYYYRVAEIDGGTWYRGERFLRREEVDGIAPPRELDEALRRLHDVGERDPIRAIRALVRRAAGDVDAITRIFELVLGTAADDPALAADHATILAPRGTNLERPWELGRADFLCWVVFRNGFVPRPPLAEKTTIRRSVHAHHSVKKERIARKYLAKYGPESRASLEDDLGALGLYFDESAHHRGHQITGIQAAMRMLMPIDIQRGDRTIRIEGLTDFRLTRVTPGEAARFEMRQYPRFHAYGQVVRALVEATFEDGTLLPPILGV